MHLADCICYHHSRPLESQHTYSTKFWSILMFNLAVPSNTAIFSHNSTSNVHTGSLC